MTKVLHKGICIKLEAQSATDGFVLGVELVWRFGGWWCFVYPGSRGQGPGRQALVIFSAICIQTILLTACPELIQIVQFAWYYSTKYIRVGLKGD